MLNKIAKLLLIATSAAPILLTLWFVEISGSWDSSQTYLKNITSHWDKGLYYILSAVVLSLICLLVISLSYRKLEKLPVQITNVKSADKEILGFLLVYLLPLINQSLTSVSTPVLVFVSLIFFCMIFIFNSHAFNFNPVLAMFGFHFYEVIIKGDITYILITRQKIANCRSISTVVQLSQYMILEEN